MVRAQFVRRFCAFVALQCDMQVKAHGATACV